jgi:octanoyl-[GcvH]:protein N-octanoyltransferase
MDVDLVRGRAGEDRALEPALAQALLGAAARGERGAIVRSYRPQPTVAFGRQDSLRSGFEDAAAAARAHGFEPVIRAAGGHAAAYHQECLVLDEVMPAPDAIAGTQERFAAEAERHAHALRGLGVEARVGEVPGEYCPGRFTVNARGAVKLIGSAQRIVKGAWLFSVVVVVSSEDPLREVLTDVYAALELAWDPRTVGAVAAEAPGVTVEQAEQALLAGYASRYRLVPAALAPEAVAAARLVLERHRVTGTTGGP